MKDFEGRGIIVTGATRGIGRAIAMEVARRGANVSFNYVKSDQQAAELKAEIEKLGVKALAYKVDVGDLKSVREMVNATKKEFGQIDGLVNNAGMTRDKVFVMMSEEDWNEVIRVNLTGAFNFARAAAFMMMKAKRGSILNITSVSGLIGLPGQANYSAAKAGLIGLTKSVAKEVGRLNVRVNALALGFIETDMTASLPEENRAQSARDDTARTLRQGRRRSANGRVPADRRRVVHHGRDNPGGRRPRDVGGGGTNLGETRGGVHASFGRAKPCTLVKGLNGWFLVRRVRFRGVTT